MSTEPILDAQQKSAPRQKEGKTGRPCLLVILRPQLTLAKDVQWPIKGFALENKRYGDTGVGEWTGIYDWLRDAGGNLLGVRYTPADEMKIPAEVLKGLPYIKLVPPCHLEIYFSDRQIVEPTLPCDQAFMYDAVFRSEDGEYAIGFDMEELDESNLRSLENAPVDWAIARSLE